MRRASAVAGAAALLAAALATFAINSPSAIRETDRCNGSWRWPIKTLGDKPRLSIQKNDVQVSQLWDIQAPDPLNAATVRTARLETTIYTLTATLMYARRVDDDPDKNGKGGGDLDYHLVIADPKDPKKTMIVEFPDPRCAKGATTYRRAQMTHARAAFDSLCQGAPRHRFANLSGTATITGVGFFDRPHANGHSKTGVELHPVLSFSSDNCRWVH